jgi:hypothetical protein
MLLMFSTPGLIRHLWLLKTVVFLHWCLICAIPLPSTSALFYVCEQGQEITLGATMGESTWQNKTLPKMFGIRSFKHSFKHAILLLCVIIK